MSGARAAPCGTGTALSRRGLSRASLTWQGLRAVADGVVQDSGSLHVRRRLEAAPGAG